MARDRYDLFASRPPLEGAERERVKASKRNKQPDEGGTYTVFPVSVCECKCASNERQLQIRFTQSKRSSFQNPGPHTARFFPPLLEKGAFRNRQFTDRRPSDRNPTADTSVYAFCAKNELKIIFLSRIRMSFCLLKYRRLFPPEQERIWISRRDAQYVYYQVL